MQHWQPNSIEPEGVAQVVVGQLGQSLDGQIATSTGCSKYINGPSGLKHLHMLRAWADAVIVGVGTVIEDNPRLTVRLVSGENPMRLVLDPRGRAPVNATLMTDQAARTVVLRAVGATSNSLPSTVEEIRLADSDGQLAPAAVLDWLAGQGCQRVLVEGGPATLAGFLAAQCVDHLHLLTSAVLLGMGKPGLNQPSLSSLAQARRFRATAHLLGEDLLLACDLRQRLTEGEA